MRSWCLRPGPATEIAMRTRVKICGITNLADALRAATLGADYLGFNFYNGSPRYITPAKARRIVRQLPRGVKPVGIFVDAPPRKIAEIARQAGIRIIQLHGGAPSREVLGLARKFGIWRVIRVRGALRTEQVRRLRSVQALLLDAFHPDAKGGTGKTFDWKLARKAKRHGRIILAGGLTAENVGEAIRVVHPWAVDVANGVELRPGKKDARRMRAFVRAVRAAKVR